MFKCNGKEDTSNKDGHKQQPSALAFTLPHTPVDPSLAQKNAEESVEPLLNQLSHC